MSNQCRCAGDNRYWFDRAECECGHMHYRCENCGDPLDCCYAAEKRAFRKQGHGPMSLNIPKKDIAVTDNDDDNDWQIPDGLVESLQQSAARRKEKLLITREALDNFTGWVSEAQQLRKTLTDLITSLQGIHVRYPYALSDGFFCDTCQKDWPCPTVQAVDAIRGEDE